MIQINHLKKIYQSKAEKTIALNDVSFNLRDKGFIVLTGKSGSGKSTLLNILGGLDRFTDGEIIINGKSTKKFKGNEWDSYRNTYVGFVFQEFYIIDEFTVGKNIALALELQGVKVDEIDTKVDEILTQVDLQGFKDRKPNEISGGQKQRIAIARALIKNPQIILADEPTGNLDSETGRLVLDTLKKLSKTKLVIMVTHDHDFAREYGDRIIELKDGNIINDYINVNHHIDKEAIFEGNDGIKSMIKLPRGRNLTQNIINYLNEYLQNSNKDVYFTLSDQKAFAKGVIPEAVLHAKTDDESYKEVDYTLEGNSTFSLKKTSLPFQSALKLALSSLLKKKVRLLFMSLCFITSLIFMGIALNFTFYDVPTAMNQTFKQAKINEIPLMQYEEECEGNTCWSGPIPFLEEDFTSLQENHPKLGFLTSYQRFIDFNELVDTNLNYDKKNEYYAPQFQYIAVIDNKIKDLHYTEGKAPQQNEIAITDYMADMFISYQAIPGISKQEDLIGQELVYESHTIKISGIVKTNYHKYDELKNMYNLGISDLYMSFFNDRSLYQRMFVTKDTFNQAFKRTHAQLPLLYKDSLDQMFYPGYESSIPNIAFNQYLIGDSRLPENDNEITLSLQALIDIKEIEVLNQNPNDIVLNELNQEITLYTENFSPFKGRETKETTYTLVGVYDDYEINNNIEIILTENEFYRLEHSTQNEQNLNSVLLSSDNEANIELFKDLKKLNIHHQTIYSSQLEMLDDIVKSMRITFLIIGSVFSAFAAILILSFITSSINQRQKEIGTLRALGARGIDVSKIFITEGIVIALFTSIVANIGIYLIINALNNQVTRDFKTSLVLLYVNIYHLLMVLGFALIMVFISSFLPIKRITMMRPIKAIKNLK